MGAGPRRGRKPSWLSGAAETEPAEVKVKEKKAAPGRRKSKRTMSEDGKLAIRAGVMLRHWKTTHAEATEEEVAKQRERFVQQLRRQG